MTTISSTDASPSVLSRRSSQTSFTVFTPSPLDIRDEWLASTKVSPVRRICFVGGGYVGGPTAAVMAYCNPSIEVTVVDMNEERIRSWQGKHLPIHEPGLSEIVRIARDGANQVEDGEFLPRRQPNLFFLTQGDKHIAAADIIFISVNTPTKMCGWGSGAATDMWMFESAAKNVAREAKPGAIIVEKSTVPARTAEMVGDILSFHRPGESFEVLSNPEFLAEGTAITDLLNPSRVLIGSFETISARQAAARLASVYSWVPRSNIVTIDVFSSELSKLVANAMLAQRITSMNTVSAICERTGADVDNVARTIGLDPRIGSKFLKAGLGFGGSCFKKDILSLSYLAESLDLPEVAHYWRQVVELNEWQCKRFVKSVLKALNGSLRGKKVCVLGYAFKRDTADTRESQAAEVVRLLLQEAPREISIFDPMCKKSEIEQELASAMPRSSTVLSVCESPYTACGGAAAVLVLTEWKQFSYPPVATTTDSATSTLKSLVDYRLAGRLRSEPSCESDCAICLRSFSGDCGSRASDNLDWPEVARTMDTPRWVFDARGMVAPVEMEKLGFRVAAIGKPAPQLRGRAG